MGNLALHLHHPPPQVRPLLELNLIQRLARRGLAGGVVYDALIAAAALTAQADCIVTLNPGDFQRVVPAGTLEVREP